MSLNPSITIKPITEYEAIERDGISRDVENTLLTSLKNLFAILLTYEDLGDTSALEIQQSKEATELEETFNQLYRSWQFDETGKQGLGEGAKGEMFARLIGSNILDEFPEKCPLPYNTAGYGLRVIQLPNSSEANGIIEVITTVKDIDLTQCCYKYIFSTSINRIDKRLLQVAAEKSRLNQDLKKLNFPETDKTPT